MYSPAEVKTVHLELTTKCNAECSQCIRTLHDIDNDSEFSHAELSLKDCKKILPPALLKQLRRIYLCGNFGDPAAARDALEIVEYLRAEGPHLQLDMFTNGSLRSPNWWAQLAASDIRVRWSIDGLEDTNAVYRRKTSFKKIMQNLKAFIDAGGWAEWDFLVFKHNEHQVEQVVALATEMGLYDIRIKKTGRFFSKALVEQAYSRSGRALPAEEQDLYLDTSELMHWPEAPTDPRHRNTSSDHLEEIIRRHGSLTRFFQQNEILCQAQSEKSIYISAEALAFPCCWLGQSVSPWKGGRLANSELAPLVAKLSHGKDGLSLRKHSLEDIITNSLFQTEIPSRWSAESGSPARLSVCAKHCGKNFECAKTIKTYSKAMDEIEGLSPR